MTCAWTSFASSLDSDLRYTLRIQDTPPMNTHAHLLVHGTVVDAIAFAAPLCFRMREVVHL